VLAGSAQTAAAQDVSTDTPTDVSPDMVIAPPTDVPPDMVIAPPTDVPPDMLTATPTATPTILPTATPTVVPTATATAKPTVNPTVIQQVIQHSSDEQTQVINTRNLSLLSDTQTADQFQQLTSQLQDMLNHQVTGIALVKLDWGPIAIAADGLSATATTYETWRIISQVGSIDYDPVRNDYTLVLDNGTWKIKSDAQVMIRPGTPTPAAGVPGH
jgi:hypothetical protein